MRRVLITGGTGSFGRAFTYHLLTYNLAETVCIFSRDEHKQALMRSDFNNDPRLRWFIGDVRDPDRLSRAMHGVDVVVHASALKRIETGYYNPDEMVKTNVLGAINVIHAAKNVEKVVALSTDKAFQPVSPYGMSKALAESLFLNANHMSVGPIFSVARYGNVWASNGSVVPAWKQLISAGAKTVPVTDPDCTRFFMLMIQAVSLVTTLIETMKGGELAIPHLPAYRLGDLAKAFGVEMEVKGLPSWEKKHESMSEDMRSDEAQRMTVEDLRDAIAI